MHDLKLFEDWCKEKKVWLDPRLELKYEESTGLTVFARDLIPAQTTGKVVASSKMVSATVMTASIVLSKTHSRTMISLEREVLKFEAMAPSMDRR